MINSVLLVLSGFALALLAPGIVRFLGRGAKWALAIYPGVVTAYLLSNLDIIMRGEKTSLRDPVGSIAWGIPFLCH